LWLIHARGLEPSSLTLCQMHPRHILFFIALYWIKSRLHVVGCCLKSHPHLTSYQYSGSTSIINPWV
jgi:hypothetical protein